MAYVPSHQELREHPKTRKAARKADVSIVQMIGHLHLLWWWALDHAPDGDLSKFDADDLADAVMWEGDPEVLAKALIDCGPGDSEGFLDADWKLHDWEQYGGKYGQRVAAAKKAAAVRWQSDRNADASSQPPTDTHQNGTNPDAHATAMPPHSDRNAGGNAEERRREETTTSDLRPDPDVSSEARKLTRHFAERVKSNGHSIPTAGTKNRDDWLIEMDRLLRLGPPGEGGHVPDADEVAKVIDWCAADQGNGNYPGEATNVRSVRKFRERYSELRRKALRRGEATGDRAALVGGGGVHT